MGNSGLQLCPISVCNKHFLPVSILAQVFLLDINIPISTVVSFAGSISLIYIRGNKGNNIAETLKLNKDPDISGD